MPVYCGILNSRWTFVYLALRTTGTGQGRKTLAVSVTDVIKKTFYIFLFFQTFISCRQEPPVTKTSFDYIDISFNNGRTGIISVFVDSSKVIKVLTIDHDNKNHYYQDTLKDSDIIKLNRLSNKALMDKFDTVVGSPSCFSFPCYLIIASKDKNIRTLVYQDINYSFKPLDSLTKNIILLTRTIKQNPLDSNFAFNSLKKVIGPPSLTKEMEEFIPPVIKDN
jgi:hypothetical protein